MADKVAAKAQEEEHIIKPQATTPAADTSDWPLLLKNYDKREDPISQPTLENGVQALLTGA
jgi:hypothetical protein